MPEGEVVYHIRGDNSKLPDDLKNAEKIIGESAGKVEKAALGAIKAIGAAASAAAAAGVTIGTAAVKSADDLDKAVKRVTSATGAGAEAAQKYSDVIKEVYGDNFGESFDDIATSISTITQNLGEMDAEPLKKVAESAYALQDAFDMDVAESSRAAKAMAENFGIAAEDAYDYIAKGAQDGLNYSGELLDNISEYSVQFKKLGLSADDMFTIFANGAENGAWNLDKIGDAVKEFSIRAIDGSDTTKKGFEALGYDAEDMAKKFAQGGDAARDAFQTVVKALGDMEDPIKQNEAGVNLFGTMWEDLGADAVKALGDISNSAYDCAGAVDEIVEVNYSSLSDALGGLQRQVELLIQPLGDELIPLVEGVINKLSEISKKVVPVLLRAAEPLVESLLELIDPISQMVTELLPPLIELAADIAKKISEFTAKHIPSLIHLLKSAVDFISNALKTAWEMRDVIAAIVAALITFNTAIKIGNAVSAAISALKAFKTITDAATASQVALNVAGAANPFVLIASLASGAIAAIAAFNETTETTAEKVQALHDKTAQLNEAAKDSGNATKELSKLTDEYKELKTSADDTGEAKERLQEIQDILIGTYGAEAEKIDLVNGKYSEQLGLLKQIADKKDEDARRDATIAYNEYLEQEKAENDIVYTNKSNEIDGYTFGGPVFGEPIFSYSAAALRDERVKKLFEELAADNENIAIGKESITINGNGQPDYNVSVSGSTAEKTAAYKAIVEAFEEAGLDTAGGDISKYYKDYVESYKKYKEADEVNQEVVKNYQDANATHLPSDGSAGSWRNREYSGGKTYIPSNGTAGNWRNTEYSEKTESGNSDSQYTYKPYVPTVETSAKSTKASSSTSSAASGSKGNFISITSYVPTMWDNDQTAALKSLIGKDVLGKTTSAHQINALTGAVSGAAESASASKETDLADVINAITKLQRKVEGFESAFGDMTIELTADDLTIGKACVRDCNIMAKRSGKSPFNF